MLYLYLVWCLQQVTILDSLHGHKGVVPLLDYGVTCSNSSSSSSAGQQPQWLLVFPRYSGSLRGWRLLRGQGLDQEDLGLYLRIFMQVSWGARCGLQVLHATMVQPQAIRPCAEMLACCLIWCFPNLCLCVLSTLAMLLLLSTPCRNAICRL